MTDGVLHIGDDRVVSARDRSLLKTSSGWRLLWSGAVEGEDAGSHRQVPLPGAGRDIGCRPHRDAGRRRASGRNRSARAPLLRQDEWAAAAPGPARRSRPPRCAGSRSPTISSPQPRGRRRASTIFPTQADTPANRGPWALRTVPDDVNAPKRIGDGFVLLGVYGQPGRQHAALLQRRTRRALRVRGRRRAGVGRAAVPAGGRSSSTGRGPGSTRRPRAPRWSGSTTASRTPASRTGRWTRSPRSSPTSRTGTSRARSRRSVAT